MANTWSWPALVTAVTTVTMGVLTLIFPRLFQRESRRLQLEAETRVKRLEALEKAMSVVEKAKAVLRIEVSTYELQNELERILHEFAGPVVQSREALEDWAGKSLEGRFLRTPRFSAPEKEARFVRGMRISSFIAIFMFWFYGTSMILSITSLNGPWKLILFYCALWGILYFSSRVFILRESKSALKALHAMPKNIAEVNTPVLVVAAPA